MLWRTSIEQCHGNRQERVTKQSVLANSIGDREDTEAINEMSLLALAVMTNKSHGRSLPEWFQVNVECDSQIIVNDDISISSSSIWEC